MNRKTWIGIAAGVTALCTAAGSALAQAGDNNCGSNIAANTIPGGGGTVNGSLTGATTDGSACAGSGIDVYYYFTPSSTGSYRFTLCGTGTAFDSVLSIHTGCPASGANYATGAAATSCNDDFCGLLSQFDSSSLNSGTQYVVRVARFSGSGAASFTLTVTPNSPGACCTNGVCAVVTSVAACAAPGTFQGNGSVCTPNPCPQPPANNDCAGAVAFNNVPGFTTNGSTFAATTTTGAASACGAGGANDVWYAFTPSVTGNFTATLCATNPAWDSVLSVHTACPGTAANQIAGACNDDGCISGIGLSAITSPFPLTMGQTYYVRVAGYPVSIGGNPIFGNFTLTVTSDALGACCDAGTGGCTITSLANCVSPNTWTQGAICQPNPCPLPSGACCESGGVCTITDSATCLGTFQGPGTPCSPNPCPAPPANDACTSATMANLGANPGTLLSASPGGANVCESDTGGGGGADVYFSFTPMATGAYEISLCGDDWDTVLSVHTGCEASPFNEIACDDDGCGIFAGPSQIDAVNLTNGTTYIIRVGLWDLATPGGPFVLNITSVTSGACCAGDGTCAISTSASCLGTFLGDNTTCTPNNCPQPGACCSASGCCTITLAANCVGTFQGPASLCGPGVCGAAAANDDCSNAVALTLGVPNTGSTCRGTSNDLATASCIAAGGTGYRGLWFTFTPTHTAAYSVSACGSTHDTILSMYTTDCNFFTEVGCDDDACDGVNPPGSGLASNIASVTLTAGTTYHIMLQAWGFGAEPVGGDYSLVVNSVSALGTCCISTACTLTDMANCTGTFTAGGSCSPNPCGTPATGACCCGSSCTITTAAACTGVNRAFAGPGTSCTPFSNTVPCCRGDYNKTGAPATVQDIFDFLGGYFSSDPCADSNDTGGAPTVQDIFDFLGAYFGGGC